MSVRKLAFEAVAGNAEVLALVPAEQWVARGALTERLTTPFVVYAIGEELPAPGPVRRTTVEFWVHDEPGDYTRIDDILEAIKVAAESTLQSEGYGYRMMVVEWTGNSGDLSDEGLHTATRTGGFRAVGRRL